MVSASDLGLSNLLITPIVQVLGRVLLHFIWQGLAVALVLWLLFFVFRTSQVRYILACAALVVMTLLPIFTGVRVAREQARIEGNRYVLEALANSTAPTSSSENAGLEEGVKVVRAMPATQNATNTPATSDKTNYLQVTINIDRYLPWLVVSWFVGVVALSIRLLGGLFVTQRLRTKLTKAVPKEIEERLESLASQLKLKGVKVLESLSVQVPMVIGWLQPVVLLPTSAISGLSVKQLEMILAHELAHIRRHDYLVNLLQTVIETLFFYHPAVWWVSHKIRETREHCCDDLAVALCGGNKFHYAQALASLDGLRPGSNLAVSNLTGSNLTGSNLTGSNLTVAASGGSLVQRIERLAGRNPQTGGVMNWLVSLMLVLVPWLVLSSSYAQAKLPVEIEQNIDDFVKGRLESWNVPGIQVAVIQDGEVTFNKAYGLADVENNRAMTVDIPIQLGSGSWIVHAIAAMQLVDQGKLDLDKTIADHLPWVKFKNGEEAKITVRQLVFSGSNIPDSIRIIGSQDFTLDNPSNFDKNIQTAEEFIRSQIPDKLYTRLVNTDNDYSYVNTDVLLMLILEQVSGMSLETYMEDNIFTPLQLQATYDVEKAKSQGLAVGYSSINNGYDYEENPSRKMEANSFTPPSALRVPLGLSMSSQDFVKLLSAIVNQDSQLLSPDGWSAFLDSPDIFQSLWGSGGWWGNNKLLSNIGITESSQVFFEVRPESRVAYVTMTNYILPTDTNPLYQVLGSVAQSLQLFDTNSPLTTAPANEALPNPNAYALKSLSGTFTSALGTLELFPKDDELHGTLLGHEFKLVGFAFSYITQSDFEPIDGLVFEHDNQTIRLDGRQFAYRVN
jgi:CubicO group peptidase (beta-lactamase class C family)/beta-lactamase regulating signal transducer with metallopeptidase domain